MLIKIESRRDYELHTEKVVADTAMSNKQKAIMRKLIMEAFDNGQSFSQKNLSVEVL